ncbi:MAG TPA: ankyrin repeat domain-containing protein [Vicinamibacterales bacterium]|nr:ankyrin repeat domain-containing protein [Vicinamibacterales bacterium]
MSALDYDTQRHRGTEEFCVSLWVILLVAVATTALAAAGDSPLIEAVKGRNVEAVRSLLKQKVDVNARQGDGATALHWAVHRSDDTIVDLLLRAGAKPDLADDTGATPLYLACLNRSGATVERLLQARANPNAALVTGETVLMTCARTGEAAGVRALIARGANVNVKEPGHDQTALMWAAAQSHPDAVDALLKGGADVRARSRSYTQTVTSEVTQRAGREELNYTVPRGGSTPLLFAARSGDDESVKLLVEAGADVNDTLADGASALVIAAHSGHTRAAVTLLEKGADPNAADIGYTALHAAVLRSDLELVKTLLARKADPNAQITKGTPVRRTSQDFELPKVLIGATPYLLAARFLEADIMRALAAGGADTRLPMSDGATPLLAAAGMGIVAPTQDERRGTNRRGLAIVDGGRIEPETQVLETVSAALNLGSDINGTNPAGDTALHVAANQGYDSVVKLLVEQGADLNARNAKGLTPLGALEARAGARTARKSTIDLLRSLGATE